MTFAFVFEAGPFRVRKYESVVLGFDIRVEVVSEEQKASLVNYVAGAIGKRCNCISMILCVILCYCQMNRG